MPGQPVPSEHIFLEVTRAELILLNNALNEVCHGIDIDEEEFPTRLGGSRKEAQALLQRIGQLLDEEQS